MKKINFLIITFALTSSLSLFSQGSEQLKTDEEVINEVITDKNIDYILDIDSLFETEEENLEALPESTPPPQAVLPSQPTSSPQIVLPSQPTPSQTIISSQPATPVQTVVPNQGNRVVFNVENFFYKSNNTTNVFSTFNENKNFDEKKDDITNKSPRNEVFIIIKKENGNESTVLTNRSEILIESPRVTAPVTTNPVVQDDAFLAIELLKIIALIKDKSYGPALKNLGKLKEIFPQNTRIWNIEGSIYYKLKFYEFALKTWQKSLALNPDQPLVERFVDRLEAIN